MNASELASIKRQAYINAGLNYRTVENIFGSPSDTDLQNSDWIDALYRDGRMSVYDISLSGGDERTKFFLSGSHTYHQGQIIQSDYTRSTGRMNLSHKVNERLTIGANFSLAKQVTNGSIDRGNFVNSPLWQVMRPDPMYLSIMRMEAMQNIHPNIFWIQYCARCQ